MPGRAEAIFPIFLLYRPSNFFFLFLLFVFLLSCVGVLSVQSRDPTPQAVLNKIIHNSSFFIFPTQTFRSFGCTRTQLLYVQKEEQYVDDGRLNVYTSQEGKQIFSPFYCVEFPPSVILLTKSPLTGSGSPKPHACSRFWRKAALPHDDCLRNLKPGNCSPHSSL